MQPTDQAQRIAYWTEQMEQAHGFMMAILDYPVRECGEPMVSMEEAARAAGVDIEFSRTPFAPGYERVFYLRRGLIDDFLNIAEDLNGRGWVMLVEDGFRSTAMQRDLAKKPGIFDVILQRLLWECNGELPSPEFMFRRASALVATIPKIGTHMSGSAIDISVLNRGDRTPVDRGGPYVELSERTPMRSPFVSPEALRNRAEITEMFEVHGLMAYPFEFWHYNKGDAYDEYLNQTGSPARYGAIDWDPQTGAITPIADPKQPLHSTEDIRAEIEKALRRLKTL